MNNLIKKDLLFPFWDDFLDKSCVRYNSSQKNAKDTFYIMSGGFPKADLVKTDKDYLVMFAVPGIRREDINVETTSSDGVSSITISGQYTVDIGNGSWLWRELKHSEFRRTITTPEHASVDKMSAELKDGILTLKIPYVNKETKPAVKRITVT